MSLLILISGANSDEFEITASKIKFIDNNKKIEAKGNVVATSKDGLLINADEIIYDKKNNTYYVSSFVCWKLKC